MPFVWTSQCGRTQRGEFERKPKRQINGFDRQGTRPCTLPGMIRRKYVDDGAVVGDYYVRVEAGF